MILTAEELQALDEYTAEHIMKFENTGMYWSYTRENGKSGSWGRTPIAPAPGWHPTRNMYQALMVLDAGAFESYSISKSEQRQCYDALVEGQFVSDRVSLTAAIVAACVAAHKSRKEAECQTTQDNSTQTAGQVDPVVK